MSKPGSSASTAVIVDATTILSLLAVLAILAASYALSLHLLPTGTAVKVRLIYIWHLFDGLIHLLFEGAFLYNCFFVYADGTSPTGFLKQPHRTYGPSYGLSPTAKLWQEYARADARWGGADSTVISIELLTVFLGGPLALWICEGLRRQNRNCWLGMVVLATAELYGGFMTFCPEWLTGSPNLDTSNFMYLWVYLFFFNTLWVWLPLYVLYEAYGNISLALASSNTGSGLLVQAASKKQRQA
ncbi:MAG: hypothetical protein M1837_004005 [Sclerophora amabilis]|nr:MAG: hypothetical protein M1837_004005 [Sclerophora amabilis]